MVDIEGDSRRIVVSHPPFLAGRLIGQYKNRPFQTGSAD
jgi:hypothetical protein